jgi:hypothetical protein
MSEQRYMDQSVGVCPSASYKGPISTWSSLDLESANGVRFPVAANSQHNWKTAWIMIYEPGNPPTTAELDDIADLLDGYCERWSTITLGRGTMTQTLFDDCDCSGIPGGGCLPCFGDSACADELFCNGVDSCNATTGLCDHEGDPCADQGLVCYEPDETCVECFDSRHCDDGLFCNGVESCDLSTKTCIRPDADPCAAAGLACSEEQDRCVECVDDGDCASPERCDPASNSCVDPLRNCGNGVDCHSCPADCEGTTSGPQSGRFCCGNGLLEPPEGDGSICDHNP